MLSRDGNTGTAPECLFCPGCCSRSARERFLSGTPATGARAAAGEAWKEFERWGSALPGAEARGGWAAQDMTPSACGGAWRPEGGGERPVSERLGESQAEGGVQRWLECRFNRAF